MPSTIARLEAEVRADTGDAQRDLGELESSLDSGGDAMDKMGGHGKALAAGLGAVTVAAGLVAGAVSEAMSLDAVNDKLAASLGATPAQAKKYGDAAANLYKGAWGDSVADVSDSIGSVVKNIGGMSTASQADVEAVTAKVLDLNSAMGTDTAGVTKAVGQMMKTGLAKNAAEALDIITVGFQKGADKSEDFLDTLNEYGTQFRKLGIDGATATGLLSQGLQAGARDGDLVADAIKEFSIRAIDGSTTTQAGYKAIGLSATKMTAQIAKGGVGAQQGLATVLDGLRAIKDPAKQAQAATALFGTQAEDLGGALYALHPETAAKGLGTIAGAATKMGATLNDNASANITAFKRTLTLTAVQAIGGLLIPAITSASKMVNTYLVPAFKLGTTILGPLGHALMDVFGFLADHQGTLKIVAGIITAVFLPALVQMGVQSVIQGAKLALMWAAQTTGAVAGAAATSLAAVKTVAGWVLMGAQSMIQGARMAAAWLLAMGPIPLIIAAIVGLVVLIVKNWDKIKAVTVAVFGAVLGFVKDVFSKITGAVSAAIGWVRNNWPLLLAILTGPIGLAVLAIVKSWDKITAGFRAAFTGVKNVAGELVGFVKGIPGMIVGALGDLGGLLLDAGGKIIGGLVKGIKDKIPDVKGMLGGLTKKLTSWKGPPRTDATILTGAGRLVMGGFIRGLVSQRKAVKAALGGFTSLVGSTVVPPLSASVTASSGSMGLGTGDTAMARLGQGAATQAAVSFTFHTYNPVAEAESVTQNKALDRVAALSLV